MGSRLRPVPDKVLECLIEVSAPSGADQGAKLLSYYPETYEDVAMLQEVVTEFCFPFDKDTEMVDAVQHFTFVLTSIDSLYRFGFCRYPPKAKTCLCILSDLPAFEMFYAMLNTLAELENAHGNEVLTVNQFMDLVLESQVPEPGCKFTINVPEKDWKKQYNYPDPSKLPSIPENRNLTDYFSAVDPSKMIALFASMMFERRIIITSKKLSLLTACTYSASSLMYPMHWQHVYIPTIPPSLVEYCCAPMPFLIGVHSSLMSKVREMPLDDVVILDVDKNEIELPFDDVENVPSEAIHKLESALKKSTIAIGDYVSQQFLSANVTLIAGYRDALTLSSDRNCIVFDRELFVNTCPHMKPFLEHLLTLQLFEQFIQHKLAELNDGKVVDDVFDEQVGLHAGSNSNWSSQYKQWVKNRKRDGSQILKDISGKTGKARSKANKFIQSGFVQMKNHSKSGWKGLKEKRKTLVEYVKGGEVDLDDDDDMNGTSGLQKCNSLPMRKANGIQKAPSPTRNSIGSSLQHRVVSEPALPTDIHRSPGAPRRPSPSRPPSRVPPRPPTPYRATRLASSDEEISPKPRPSMVRDPKDPPVRDLIVFYNSQEDLTNPSQYNPFREFKEFDYKLAAESKDDISERSSSNTDLSDSLLWETFVSLSDGTREFLRQSHIESTESVETDDSREQSGLGSGQEREKSVQKTLKELALDHRLENNGGITHAGSCPSLVDPDTKSVASSARSSSSTNIAMNCVHANKTSHVPEAVERARDDMHHSDPFVELIAQRHKLNSSALQNGNSRWVTDFE